MEGEDKPTTVVPIYEFAFDSGVVRSTEHMDGLSAEAAEVLADFGRDDDECTVRVTGYHA